MILRNWKKKFWEKTRKLSLAKEKKPEMVSFFVFDKLRKEQLAGSSAVILPALIRPVVTVPFAD